MKDIIIKFQENKNGRVNGRFSVITSIKWRFRGGTSLACAGKDSRLLAVSAKRSQATKVKDLAYTKINIEKTKLMKQINENQQNTEQNMASSWDTIQNQIGEIWDAIGGGE